MLVSKFIAFSSKSCSADPADPDHSSSVRRAGYVGWYGYGGSVLQWHPGLKIGFGFATDLAAWWDKVLTHKNGKL